jgi:CCR4-NOT transcription complex subunit 6
MVEDSSESEADSSDVKMADAVSAVNDNSPWRLPILVQQQSQQSSVGPHSPPLQDMLCTQMASSIIPHVTLSPTLGHPPIQHHHPNSIPHYPSPPNPNTQHHLLARGSPATPIITPH